ASSRHSSRWVRAGLTPRWTLWAVTRTCLARSTSSVPISSRSLAAEYPASLLALRQSTPLRAALTPKKLPAPALTLLQDLHGTRAAYARHPDRPDGQLRIEVADAACGFHLDVGRRVFSHELEVFDRGPARAVARRCLDPIGLQLSTNLAQPDFL